MGGDAFSSGPDALYTPRMPKPVYLYVKNKYHNILLHYFTCVTTPIEAPEKPDYGDVDYIVSVPKDAYKGQQTLMEALGAVHSRSGPTTSFAIPWPESAHEESMNENVLSDVSPAVKKFIQVDVAIDSKGDDSYKWEVFLKSHGDLWNMLGSTIRKYGLTANDEGLHLRIEAIELIDRKKSLIFLTNDPKVVLQFLGLDDKSYWQPFNTVQEMFEYAAHCRFFWVKETAEELEEERDTDKKALKHNDRQRMRKRPLFRRWIEEFIPECRRRGKCLQEPPSRTETTREVFMRFPGAKEKYDERLQVFLRAKQTDELWRDVIKAGVPELEDNQFRSAAIRGLKAIIMADDYSLGIVPSKPLKQEEGLFDVEVVKDFVSTNWRRVGELQTELQNQRVLEIMAAKQLKREQKSTGIQDDLVKVLTHSEPEERK